MKSLMHWLGPIVILLTMGSMAFAQESTGPPGQKPVTLLIPFSVVAPSINIGISLGVGDKDARGAIAAKESIPEFLPSGSIYANNLSGILPSGTTSFTGFVVLTGTLSADNCVKWAIVETQGKYAVETKNDVLCAIRAGNNARQKHAPLL